MTSMFDQFEQAALRTKSNNLNSAEMVDCFVIQNINVNVFFLE